MFKIDEKLSEIVILISHTEIVTFFSVVLLFLIHSLLHPLCRHEDFGKTSSSSFYRFKLYTLRIDRIGKWIKCINFPPFSASRKVCHGHPLNLTKDDGVCSAKKRNERCACICFVLSAMIPWKRAIRMYVPRSLTSFKHWSGESC